MHCCYRVSSQYLLQDIFYEYLEVASIKSITIQQDCVTSSSTSVQNYLRVRNPMRINWPTPISCNIGAQCGALSLKLIGNQQEIVRRLKLHLSNVSSFFI